MRNGAAYRSSRPGRGAFPIALLVAACLGFGENPITGADLDPALRDFLSGDYAGAIVRAREAVRENPRDEESARLLVQGLLAIGKYGEAEAALTNALDRAPRSVTLRWLGLETLSSNGKPEEAAAMAAEIPKLVSARPWFYREPADLLAIGRALLRSGADPKEVLERVYGTARKAAPGLRDVYLASGDLALEKHDYALAAKQFEEGLKRFPEDPDLHCGRARAFAESDRKEMGKALEAALKANPRHVPSLLLLADHRIDAEDYDGAMAALKEARAVNPVHPEAWALAAVIVHLRNERTVEKEARTEALRFWKTNPRVPHLIGRKLSEKYRFAEGAALQREALDFDPEYHPAKAQLASDLLRLGEDAEGWDLIQEVHAKDAYDVTAFNLVTLRDTMTAFTTLTNAHFVVRMHRHEAEVYGARVLDLLERARTHLTTKYGLALDELIRVEIFPEAKDFGVRTFGMPDNPGYLGVCFGRVITANSPAANQGRPVNWESVLWHEFCHVVTLQLTANKMPRWLSEGISVYEERLANPAWGEQLNPRYREMILGDDLTPVSRLSAAFLTPKSGLHLQFAYFQSSLVIEFLVDRFGIDKLRAILGDLREGSFINTALERHTVPMDRLEKDFAAFAREKARALAPGLSWDQPRRRPGQAPPAAPGPDPDPDGRPNYWKLLAEAARQVEAGQWTAARPGLEELVRLYPGQTGVDSAHALLARVHRALGENREERLALERWAAVDGAASDAYLRLMELAAEVQDWEAVLTNANRFLAVNPLVAAPYRHQARALEATRREPEAVHTYRTLLKLDSPNPAEIHYSLARLLQSSEPPAARRHLLESLADAPRNRDALALLLRLQPGLPPAERAAPAPATPPPTTPIR